MNLHVYIVKWQATSETEQLDLKPKSMTRPKVWSEEVEEAYRFQLAGYRDEKEYRSVKKTEVPRNHVLNSSFVHLMIPYKQIPS